MSYYKRERWELVPTSLPLVKRNCPKCGTKASYVNSEKFRVNANKNNLDIWLIYQCSECKSTFNMSIYERIHPQDMDVEEYEKFLSNDKDLAWKYGFDVSLHQRNKAEMLYEQIAYDVLRIDCIQKSEGRDSSILLQQEALNHPMIAKYIIEMVSNYAIELRLDKLLSEQLGVSRSQIKRWYENGLLKDMSNQNKLLKSNVKDGMIIRIDRSCFED